MKITFDKVASASVMLYKIKELNLGVKVEYWCTRNIKILADDYVFFIKKINEINEKYCFKDEDGEYCKIVDGNVLFNLKDGCDVDAFNKEMNDTMTNECEITPFVLNESVWESLPNFRIDGCSLDAIDFLLP